MSDVTQRFSSRVEDYIKYRPAYPVELLGILTSQCGFDPGSIVADIGSGTGILSELFLRNGNVVFGIEPNIEMREAGERLLQGYPRFRSVAARAENTTLEDASVDFITAGQSFHWFDRQQVKVEFTRILRSDGWVVVVWNERLLTSPFLVAYEQLIKTYATDYEQVDHRRLDVDTMRDFFGAEKFGLKQLRNVQVFDYEGVKGRLLSSSYIPGPDHPNHAPMLEELVNLVQSYQHDGKVDIEYRTQVYFGQLN